MASWKRDVDVCIRRTPELDSDGITAWCGLFRKRKHGPQYLISPNTAPFAAYLVHVPCPPAPTVAKIPDGGARAPHPQL
jgi:hypothetical protein